ncbi:unnamed protein product [Sphagnum troendelagicum]|uniref:Uncharacterized protein n=1 Tax=Sphagnum troendelagicum TaxID=128251 RepID=A0ABP0UQ97_9BRYO
MADDGDLGFAFQNSGSGEGLSEEEVDWNQGCSTEDWSASSNLLHSYRHSKKSFQILKNRVEKPKRLAIKQSVHQHPLQSFKMMNICPDEASTVPGSNPELMKYPARLTSADPITSNSGKFMSLQELEEHIFAKRQVTHGERNSSHLSLGYLMILRARVSGEWWIYIQIYQLSRVRRQKSLQSLTFPRLRIPSPPCTNQQGSLLIEDSEFDKDMGAETSMMADFDQLNHTWELSSDRIEKVKESSEMTLQTEKLTKAIWSFNLQKEKLCNSKEFELGAVSPTSLTGQSCKVFWPLGDEWHTGVVGDYMDHTCKHLITYEDSEEEWIILAREQVKLKVSAAQRL